MALTQKEGAIPTAAALIGRSNLKQRGPATRPNRESPIPTRTHKAATRHDDTHPHGQGACASNSHALMPMSSRYSQHKPNNLSQPAAVTRAGPSFHLEPCSRDSYVGWCKHHQRAKQQECILSRSTRSRFTAIQVRSVENTCSTLPGGEILYPALRRFASTRTTCSVANVRRAAHEKQACYHQWHLEHSRNSRHSTKCFRLSSQRHEHARNSCGCH